MLKINVPVYVDWYMSRPTAAKNSTDKFLYFTQEGFNVGMIYLTKTEIENMGKKYSQTLSVKEAFDDFKKYLIQGVDIIRIVPLYQHWETVFKLQDLIRIKSQNADWKFWFGNYDEADKIVGSKRFKALDKDRFTNINWSTATQRKTREMSNGTGMNIRKLWGDVRFDQSYTEAVLGQKVKKPLFAFPEVLLSSLLPLNLIKKDEIPLIKTKIDLGIESNGELPEAYHVLYILGLIKTLKLHPQFNHHIHKFHTRNQARLYKKIGQELCKKLCNAKDPIDKKIIDMFSDKQCVILNDEVSSYRKNKKIVDKLIKKQIPCQILQCRVLDRGYDEPKIDTTGIFCTTKSFISIWQFIFRGNRRNYDKPWDEDEQLIYQPRIVDDLSEDGKKIYWESTTNTIKEIATNFKPIMEWVIAQSTSNNPGPNPPEIKDPPPYISPVSFSNPQDWMNAIKEIVITHSGSLKQSIIKTLFIDMHKAALTEIKNPKDNNEKRNFQLQDKWRNDPRTQVIADIRRGGDTKRYPNPKNDREKDVLQKIFNCSFHLLKNDPECVMIYEQWQDFVDQYDLRIQKRNEAIARLVRKFIDKKFPDMTLDKIRHQEEYRQYLVRLANIFGVRLGSLQNNNGQQGQHLSHLGKMITGRDERLSPESQAQGQAWVKSRLSKVTGKLDPINQRYIDALDNFFNLPSKVDFSAKEGLKSGYYSCHVVGHKELTDQTFDNIISEQQQKKFNDAVNKAMAKSFDIVDQYIDKMIEICDRPNNYWATNSAVVYKDELTDFIKKITGNPDVHALLKLESWIKYNNFPEGSTAKRFLKTSTKNKYIVWLKKRLQRIENEYKQIHFRLNLPRKVLEVKDGYKVYADKRVLTKKMVQEQYCLGEYIATNLLKSPKITANKKHAI